MNSLKSKVNELDVDEIKSVFVDLSKLSWAAKTNVVKKCVLEELVKNVHIFYIKVPHGVLKQYNLGKRNLEKIEDADKNT